MKKKSFRLILTLVTALISVPSYSEIEIDANAKVKLLLNEVRAIRNEAGEILEHDGSPEILRRSVAMMERGRKILLSSAVENMVVRALLTESEILNYEPDMARMYAKLGEKEKALDELESFSKKILFSENVKWLLDAPEFSTLKNEQRFIRIVDQNRIPARMGKSSVINSPFKSELSIEERVAGLSLFWAEARRNFVYFDHIPDVNWDEVYLTFLSKVIATKTTEDYYRVMMQLAPMLKDAHTNIYPPEELMDVFFARPPLRTEKIAGKVLITFVGNSRLKEKIFIGDEVLAIDGMPVQEFAETRVAPFASSSTLQDRDVRLYSYQLLAGRKTEPVTLRLADVSGKERVEIVRRDIATDIVDRIFFDFRILPGNIAFLSLDHFESDQAGKVMSRVLPQILKANGLILDIRKNGGGSTNNGIEVLSYLSDQPIPGPRSTVRAESGFASNSIDLIYLRSMGLQWSADTKKQSQIFRGQVVVLSGPKTFSAAEDFLVSFDIMKRGLIIGSATGGSTGQPLIVKLPGGGTGRICAKRDAYPDGREFVGKGISPNIEVTNTVENVRMGKDLVLERAMEVLSAGKIAQ